MNAEELAAQGKPFPAYNPNDAPAIYAALAALIANVDPPRVDVSRIWDGRLWVRGSCQSHAGEIIGYHVWYCCRRLGRAVPVNEWSSLGAVGVGSPLQYDAPWETFSCVPNEPYPFGQIDGWRAAYDAAYAALVP